MESGLSGVIFGIVHFISYLFAFGFLGLFLLYFFTSRDISQFVGDLISYFKKRQNQKSQNLKNGNLKSEDLKNPNSHFEYLVSTGEITSQDTQEQINQKIKTLRRELKREVLHEELTEISQLTKNGPTQIPFDKAMFILRHYNRRNVVSEEGNIFLGGVAGMPEIKQDFYKDYTHDQLPSTQNKNEPILIEQDIQDEDVNQVIKNEDGSFIIVGDRGVKFKVDDNKIITDPKPLITKKAQPQNVQEVITLEQTLESEQELKIQQQKEQKLKTLENKLELQSDVTDAIFSVLKDMQMDMVDDSKNQKEINQLKQKLENEKEEKQKLEDERRALVESINTCALTRAFSKKKFDADFELAFQNKKDLAFAFCDADKFKNVNDTYGHAAGDLVLIKIVDNIYKHIRELDGVDIYRIGGEEFVILFIQKDAKFVHDILEAIRAQMENSVIVDSAQNNIKITMSFGVAFLLQGESQNELKERADKALYIAKETGRNKIVFCEKNKNEIASLETTSNPNIEVSSNLKILTGDNLPLPDFQTQELDEPKEVKIKQRTKSKKYIA